MIRNGNGEQSKIDPTWYYQNNIGPLPDVTVYALQLLTSVLGPVHQVTALANKTASNRLWQGESIKVEVNDNSSKSQANLGHIWELRVINNSVWHRETVRWAGRV